jgi:hypothetical protein
MKDELAQAIEGAQGMIDHGMLVRIEYVRPLIEASWIILNLMEVLPPDPGRDDVPKASN